ncbi:TetR/AcrR family transcriptional regulator [Pseudomonas asgharzadehiana]|uniref:TetR/AcrR family transcriptional regulator n=1 Tax=Pseudomonas asgharzadehiana TaxID=2842349 RepID=A0ABX8P6A2_9PSED|nr:TetR/AcrR family transcriptional regulator [Pseudomonas asgharzadehiana]QXH69470.1 TetR/AcrR family transcriptional regulator [Pseudomonas asgharzadehiana]
MGRKNTVVAAEPAETSTKERILKIAAQLFSTRGFHATGMAELEKATGLARGALYYHIGSKEELLFEITSRYLRVLIAEGKPLCESDLPAEDKFRQFSAIVMRTIVTHLAEMTVCFREVYSVIGERQTELLDLHRQYEKLWSQILKAGVSEGTFCTSDSLAVKAILGIHHYSYLWIKPGGPRSPESIAMFFCDTLLPGLKVEPRPA